MSNAIKQELILFPNSIELTSVEDFRESADNFFELSDRKVNERDYWRQKLFNVRHNLTTRESVTLVPKFTDHVTKPVGVTIQLGSLSENPLITEGSLKEPDPQEPLEQEFTFDN